MDEGVRRLDKCTRHRGLYDLILAPSKGPMEVENSGTEHDKLVLPKCKLQNGSTVAPQFYSEPIKHG